MATTAQTQDVQITVAIPPKAASPRDRHYVGAGTKSISISTIVTSDGYVSTPYPPTVANCGKSSCNASVALYPGDVSITVDLYDGKNGHGNELSEGSISTTIVSGKVNALHLTFNGVPASVTMSAKPLMSGKATSEPVTVHVEDADGNTITGPGAYSTEIYLEASSAFSHSGVSLSQGIFAPRQAVSLSFDGTEYCANETVALDALIGAGEAKQAGTLVIDGQTCSTPTPSPTPTPMQRLVVSPASERLTCPSNGSECSGGGKVTFKERGYSGPYLLEQVTPESPYPAQPSAGIDDPGGDGMGSGMCDYGSADFDLDVRQVQQSQQWMFSLSTAQMQSMLTERRASCVFTFKDAYGQEVSIPASIVIAAASPTPTPSPSPTPGLVASTSSVDWSCTGYAGGCTPDTSEQDVSFSYNGTPETVTLTNVTGSVTDEETESITNPNGGNGSCDFTTYDSNGNSDTIDLTGSAGSSSGGETFGFTYYTGGDSNEQSAQCDFTFSDSGGHSVKVLATMAYGFPPQ